MSIARTSVLAALAALALAGCGGDGNSSGSPSSAGNEELFTTAGFQDAYDAVEEKAGSDAEVLQLQITEGGANFKLRDGESATGFVYTGGEVVDEKVEIVGAGSIEGLSFPISGIDPDALDKIIVGVREVSGIEEVKIGVLTLEKRQSDSVLEWSISAEGEGRTGLVFTADPDGSNVTDPVADAGAAAAGAQAISDCIQEAGGDVDAIQGCATQ